MNLNYITHGKKGANTDIPKIVPYSNDERGSSVAPNLSRRNHNPCLTKEISDVMLMC